MKRLALVILAAWTAACGPSVEDVCEAIDDECPDANAASCEADGHELERRAEESGCEDAFDDYLACIDDAVCSWPDRCDDTLEAFESCLGERIPSHP